MFLNHLSGPSPHIKKWSGGIQSGRGGGGHERGYKDFILCFAF